VKKYFLFNIFDIKLRCKTCFK